MSRERFSPYHLNSTDHTALAHEFGHEGIDVHLARVLPPLERKRKKEKTEKGADLYHKYFYRRLSSTLGKITDLTHFPVTDALLPGIALAEKVAQEEAVPSTLRAAVRIIESGLLASGGLYIPNMKRTPLADKLGLEQREFSLNDELQFVVQQLNRRVDSPNVAFPELVSLAQTAITEYLADKDGYRTEGTKRVKQTRLTRPFLKKMGAYGTLNPMNGEILTTSDIFTYLPAHEFAHSKGIAKEDQAQLAGVLSQIESGNPTLEYVGYAAWLNMLIRTTGFKPTVSDQHNPLPLLQDIGLNERTLQEVQQEIQYVRTERYGSKFGRKFNDIKLKLLGQKDAVTAYGIKPVAYLADYRAKKR